MGIQESETGGDEHTPIATQAAARRSDSRGLWLCVTLALTTGLYVVRTWPLVLQPATNTTVGVTTPETLRLPMTDNDRRAWAQLTRNDQSLSLWEGAWNARALLSLNPASMLAQGQCYPMPQAGTLGEHEIEFGVLFLPWIVASGSPILAYNLSLWTILLIAAAGMFLYVHRWSGNVHAAAAAGVAFALAPVRLPELMIHPSIEGFHWIPMVLWAFDEALERGRLRSFAVLSVCVAMASLVGSRPLIALAAVSAPYMLTRTFARLRRGELRSRELLLLALATLPSLAALAVILPGYGTTAANWMIEKPRTVSLADRVDFLPGGPFFPGIAATIGLLCLRLRGRDRAALPAVALAVAGLVVFLLCSRGPLWPGGPNVRAGYELLAEHFPLVRSARDWTRVSAGAVIAFQMLGMIALGRFLSRTGPAARAVLTVVVFALVLAQSVSMSWAELNFGPIRALEIVSLKPDQKGIDGVVRVLGSPLDKRAVLDIPMGRMVRAGPALVRAAYHGRATSACHQSLTPVSELEVGLLAERSGTRAGLDELAAAGFGFVVLQVRDGVSAATIMSLRPPFPARLLYAGAGMEIYELPPPPATHHDTELLDLVSVADGGPLTRSSVKHGLLVRLKNNAPTTWAAAQPVSPVNAEVTFVSRTTGKTFATRGHMMPPLALSPSASGGAVLVMDDPPDPDEYELTVSIEGWRRSVSNPSLAWMTRQPTHREAVDVLEE